MRSTIFMTAKVQRGRLRISPPQQVPSADLKPTEERSPFVLIHLFERSRWGWMAERCVILTQGKPSFGPDVLLFHSGTTTDGPLPALSLGVKTKKGKSTKELSKRRGWGAENLGKRT